MILEKSSNSASSQFLKTKICDEATFSIKLQFLRIVNFDKSKIPEIVIFENSSVLWNSVGLKTETEFQNFVLTQKDY